ncbi:MAG: ribosomal protein [Geobacteraceae bacterium]|jgi:large subunit ribosomal protein L29|nr:ribosomal protein [Geobacteraceae bacterium]
MKSKDLRNMSVDDLRSKDKELVQELFNLKFQLHTGRLENTSKLSSLKKDIARVKTVLREIKG